MDSFATLEKYWIRLRDLSCCLAQSDNFDGKAFWGSIKDEIDKVDCFVEFRMSEIKSLYEDLANSELPQTENSKFIENLKLVEVDQDGKVNKVEHFFIQLFRIPLYEAQGAKKLFQIALNVGQLLASLDKIPSDKHSFFIQNNMANLKVYASQIKLFESEERLAKLFNEIEQKYI